MRPIRSSFAPALAAAALCAWTPPALTRDLQLGLVPYLPTVHLVRSHQPLAAALEQLAGARVQVSTAPDFKTFLQRSLAGEYDVVVVGPSFGRFVQIEAGFVPLLASERKVQAVILVGADSGLTSVAHLRGKRVATMEPLTVISLLGMDLLRDSSLKPGRDVEVVVRGNPLNAAQAVVVGAADAAVVTANLLPQLPADMAGRLRELARSRELPGIMLLARPSDRLPAPATLRNELVRFFGTQEGMAFVKQLNHLGFREPSAAEMKSLDVFQASLRRELAR
jgi:phosphonate transport system substrate-binding protein